MKALVMFQLVLGLAILAWAAAAFTVMRFQHPNLTETQLLIQFWPFALSAVCGAAMAILAARRRHTRKLQ